MPLLSYWDCKDLAIISESFPKPILEVTHANRLHETDVTSPAYSPTAKPSATPPPHTSSQLPFTTSTTPAQAKEFFLSEFSDVLVIKEDLQTKLLRKMIGPQMKIHLREDAKPFAIHTPRLIPLTFQEPVKAELDSMVAQGVITPAGEDPSL